MGGEAFTLGVAKGVWLALEGPEEGIAACKELKGGGLDAKFKPASRYCS